MKIIGLFILLFSIGTCLISCKNSKSLEQTEKKSIKIVAQQMPAAPTVEFEMELSPALNTLELSKEAIAPLQKEELVIGWLDKGKPLALPIRYMAGFEVANFKLGKEQLLLTWCPLVGTAKIFRTENNQFDFAWGLIHNNLLMVDHQSRTVWAQISGEAIQGSKKGDFLVETPVIQTTLSYWKNKHPNTQFIINKDTSGAVFPAEVGEIEYYANFIPGSKKESLNRHDISHLGIGLNYQGKQLYAPFEELKKSKSPIQIELAKKTFYIHFDMDAYTAWAENEYGDLLPHTLVYKKPWLDFYPESSFYLASYHQ